jgi:hypothetical protein
MNTNEQPEFDSLEAFIAAQRAELDAQAVEAAHRAVAELEAEGFEVSTDMEQLIAQRVRQMLAERLDAMHQRLKDELQ